MSFQERRTILYIGSFILISAFYAMIVFQKLNQLDVSADPGPERLLKFWGTVLVLFVLIQIVGRILVHIILAVITAALGERDEDEIVDELERLVDLKATRNGSTAFMIGFFLSMGSLMLGAGPALMFKLLFGSLIACGIVGDVSQLWFYRRGI